MQQYPDTVCPRRRTRHAVRADSRCRPSFCVRAPLVRYSRVPFIYAPGNVLRHLRLQSLHRPVSRRVSRRCGARAVQQPARGGIILEVKYDEFLPDVIRTVVQPYCSRLQAFSKYAQCRSYG